MKQLTKINLQNIQRAHEAPHKKTNKQPNQKIGGDLNIRPDTIKLLKENIGRTLYDINHSKILFDPPPREREVKTKINK